MVQLYGSTSFGIVQHNGPYTAFCRHFGILGHDFVHFEAAGGAQSQAQLAWSSAALRG